MARTEPGIPGTGPQPSVLANNLLLRIVSALVLAPVAVAAAYIGGWPFALFWGVAGIAVLWEWIAMVAGPGHRLMFSSCAAALAVAATVEWLGRPIAGILVVALGALAAAVFATRQRRFWIVGGMAYAGALILAPILLRADESFGFLAIALLFAVVWTTDVLGYFGGRAFGGPKLAPSISPKKTWSGAIVGALGAVAVSAGSAVALGGFNATAIAFVALLLSVMSQGGDLLESWVKRRFGTKDASQLIPGHGGVMDRLDGFWAAALAACVIGTARGGFEHTALGLLVW